MVRVVYLCPFKSPEVNTFQEFDYRDECDLNKSPFVVLWLPNDEIARKIAHRSVLLKQVYERIATGPTFQETADIASVRIKSHPVFQTVRSNLSTW